MLGERSLRLSESFDAAGAARLSESLRIVARRKVGDVRGRVVNSIAGANGIRVNRHRLSSL
jgi:hypothetical protein